MSCGTRGAGKCQENVLECRLFLHVLDLRRRNELPEFREGAVGNDFPAVQDRDAVCQLFGFFQVLRGEQHRCSLPCELPNCLPHLQAPFRIQSGCWLVQENHLRAPDQAHGNVQPPAHAAGVRGSFPPSGVSQGEAFQELVRYQARLGNLPQPGYQHQVFPSAENVVDGGELAGEADCCADLCGLGYDVEPRHCRSTGIRAQKRGKDPDQGGLAGAVGAEQGEDTAGSHLELHSAQNLQVLESLVEVLDANGLHRGLPTHGSPPPVLPPPSSSAFSMAWLSRSRSLLIHWASE